MISLTNNNFITYAANNYDNPHCYDIEEFNEDLKRFQYLKKLFGRYKENDDLKIRLILNHLIIIFNVFGIKPSCRMLFLKLKDFHELLTPFLVFLNALPPKIELIEGRDIISSNIKLDQNIINELRKFKKEELKLDEKN
jgi:hypothetical protein